MNCADVTEFADVRFCLGRQKMMTFEISFYVLAVSLLGLLISAIIHKMNKGWNVVAVTVLCTVTTSVCFLYCMAVVLMAVHLYE